MFGSCWINYRKLGFYSRHTSMYTTCIYVPQEITRGIRGWSHAPVHTVHTMCVCVPVSVWAYMCELEVIANFLTVSRNFDMCPSLTR